MYKHDHESDKVSKGSCTDHHNVSCKKEHMHSKIDNDNDFLYHADKDYLHNTSENDSGISMDLFPTELENNLNVNKTVREKDSYIYTGNNILNDHDNKHTHVIKCDSDEYDDYPNANNHNNCDSTSIGSESIIVKYYEICYDDVFDNAIDGENITCNHAHMFNENCLNIECGHDTEIVSSDKTNVNGKYMFPLNVDNRHDVSVNNPDESNNGHDNGTNDDVENEHFENDDYNGSESVNENVNKSGVYDNFQNDGNNFLYWNINGLFSKLCDSNFVNFITKFDFMCFVETWANSEENQFTLDGYNHIGIFRTRRFRTGRPSGGVSFFTKNHSI